MRRSLGAVALGIACATVAVGAMLGVPADAVAATRHARSKKAAPSFPMKADEYRALMEKRIDAVRAVIDKKLDRRGVSAERKKQIHKIIDDSSKDLRAEIAKATADGTVTQAEADKVKPIANGLRAKVREQMRAEKTGSSKGEKGDKPEKGDKAEKTARKGDDKGAKDPHGKDAHGKDAHGKGEPEKVARADGKPDAKGGKTKATKAKDDAQKKNGGPTKHADASSDAKHDNATKKVKAPAPSGEADL